MPDIRDEMQSNIGATRVQPYRIFGGLRPRHTTRGHVWGDKSPLLVQYNKSMKQHSEHVHRANSNMALSATLHCLTGCAVGEIIGVTIGTHAGFTPAHTIALAAILSFVSGYTFSTWPLISAKLSFFKALRLVFAADTLSILSMTIADNLLMLSIPGAMDKNLAHPIYWLSRLLSLLVAFVVAYPVNAFLLKHGKGHALTHAYHTHMPDVHQ
jgi:Domain of unknown function (DUF4396)